MNMQINKKEIMEEFDLSYNSASSHYGMDRIPGFRNGLNKVKGLFKNNSHPSQKPVENELNYKHLHNDIKGPDGEGGWSSGASYES